MFLQVLVVLFWCLAAVCNLSVLYGLYGTVNGYVHLSNAVRSLYAALHRTAWAVGVAWVIFACVTGNGGEFFLCLMSIFECHPVRERKRKFLGKLLMSSNQLCVLFKDKATADLSN